MNILFERCLGPVGSGKTAFLNAINGNLNRISGYIHLQNIDEGTSSTIGVTSNLFYICHLSFSIGIAYVSQQPWLQHGTIRENILWGEIFDESRYRKVIWACALHKDIEDLGGDNIDIGENGQTLSGGQKVISSP